MSGDAVVANIYMVNLSLGIELLEGLFVGITPCVNVIVYITSHHPLPAIYNSAHTPGHACGS